MPTIECNKAEVLKLLGRKVSDDVLREKIPMLGTDLEQVDNKTIKVEIFPNRPDMLSTEGFARALSSFLGIKTGLRRYSVKKSNYAVKVDPAMKNIRPAVAAAVVKGVKLTDAVVQSLMQVQEKLHATHCRSRKKASIGVYDLDTIRFPLTYGAELTSFKFTPLDMNRELNLQQILAQHPKGRDYAHLMAGLKKYPIWKDSRGQVLSMPPIINSEETRVRPSTQNLFIDVTGWDQKAVELALNIIVTSLSDLGAEVHEVKIRAKKYPNLNPSNWSADVDYINKWLGLNLSAKQMCDLLAKMGFSAAAKGKRLSIQVPAYRGDILHQVDFAEEVAIAYGYDNFEPEIPNISTIADEDPMEKLKSTVANVLVGLGLMEVVTYHLTNQAKMEKCNMYANPAELANSSNQDYTILRDSLLPNVLEVLSNNTSTEYPQRVFELGTVFERDSKSLTGIAEPDHACVALAGIGTNFTHAKQVLLALGAALDVKLTIRETDHRVFIPGRAGEIRLGGKKIGIIGEIYPEVLTNWGLEIPVVAWELSLSALN